MVTAVTRIESISSPDGGPAPRDDLDSPECQPWMSVETMATRLAQDTEDLITYTAIGTRLQ